MLAVDHHVRGMVAYQAKQLAEAIEAFEAALRLEPTHYWSLMRLGYCLCDLGRGPEDFAGAAGSSPAASSIALTTRMRMAAAVALTSNWASTTRRSRLLQGRRAGSEACVRLVQPGRAYDNLGRYDRPPTTTPGPSRWTEGRASLVQPGNAYRDLGQHDKAVADFSRAVKLDPKYTLAWSNRGAVYSNHLGQYEQAVADFTQAVALDRKFVSAWYNRGLAYSKLASTSRRSPTSPRHRPGFEGCERLALSGRCLRPTWPTRQGRRRLHPGHRPGPESRRRLVRPGPCLHRLGQPAKAADDFTQAIKLNPKHADAWYNRGLVYGERLGQYPKAVADFTQAIKLTRSSWKPGSAEALLTKSWASTTRPSPTTPGPSNWTRST